MWLLAVAFVSVAAVQSFATTYFEIASADATQINADILAAGAVVIGLATLIMGYRFVRRLMGR